MVKNLKKSRNKKGKQDAVSGADKYAVKNNLFYSVLLVVFTFCIYANSINHDYAFDDEVVIRQNQFVQKGFAGIGDIFTQDPFVSFFGEQKNLAAGGRYRPLSIVTFAIEHELFGQNPAVSHFINVLLYAVTGIIIFLLLQRLLLLKPGKHDYLVHLPFVTALLFLAHPVHTEVVANIKGRDEILSLLFSLGAAYAFIKYLDEDRKVKYLLTGAGALLLGLLSKENAIAFAAVIPVMIWFFREARLKEYGFILASVILSSGIFLFLHQTFTTSSIGNTVTELMNNPFLGMTVAQKYATIIFTFGKYLSLLVLPVTLTHDYNPYHISAHSFSDAGTIVSAIICVAALIIAFVQFRKKTLFSFCVLFFAATFFLVSNLVFPVGTFMAERFLYMPSLAFCLLLAYGITLIPQYSFNRFPFQKNAVTLKVVVEKFFRMRSIQLLLLISIGGYSVRTILRNPAWKDNFTLFSTDVKHSPNSASAHAALGSEYTRRGENSTDVQERNTFFRKAISEYKKAIHIYPEYPKAYYNLGVSYYNTGQLDSAEFSYRKTIEFNPDYLTAINNLGICLMDKGKIDSAIAIYNLILKKDSTFTQAYINLGYCYHNLKDYDRAVYYSRKALALDPGNTSLIDYIQKINEWKKSSPSSDVIPESN